VANRAWPSSRLKRLSRRSNERRQAVRCARKAQVSGHVSSRAMAMPLHHIRTTCRRATHAQTRAFPDSTPRLSTGCRELLFQLRRRRSDDKPVRPSNDPLRCFALSPSPKTEPARSLASVLAHVREEEQRSVRFPSCFPREIEPGNRARGVEGRSCERRHVDDLDAIANLDREVGAARREESYFPHGRVRITMNHGSCHSGRWIDH
jgi:hypothetical protein